VLLKAIKPIKNWPKSAVNAAAVRMKMNCLPLCIEFELLGLDVSCVFEELLGNYNGVGQDINGVQGFLLHYELLHNGNLLFLSYVFCWGASLNLVTVL